MVVVLGPTASGKTAVAARFALQADGEIISADSRQVYRRMTIGTGKDLSEYSINGINIPYHLIDIREPGYHYNVYEYQHDFLTVYNEIKLRNKLPVLCGGSPLYIDAVLRSYKLHKVQPDHTLRASLEQKSTEELIQLFTTLQKPHNKTDFDTRKRLIRAIEIAIYNASGDRPEPQLPVINSLIIGIRYERGLEMERIKCRLEERLKNGLIEEVESLLKTLTPEQLQYYGLEYKFVSQYLCGKIDYNRMINGLNIAIRQFAKRQMTWFRKMEREGLNIHWLNGTLTMEEKVVAIQQLYNDQ